MKLDGRTGDSEVQTCVKLMQNLNKKIMYGILNSFLMSEL